MNTLLRCVGYRIASDPFFRQQVNQLRAESTLQAVGKLSSVALQAVDTLVELLGEPNEPRDRLAAAKAILATLAPLSEFGEIRHRIDALENDSRRLRIAP